jgi:DNA polymerase-3 subunit epsilon
VTRQIVLDTETTGLDPRQGHRIIEIGCVEVVNRQLTHRHFHIYLNPEREVEDGATNVHGLTWDDLRQKPRFREIAAEFLDFIRGAELIIHNAPFDLAFLDYELTLAGLPLLTQGDIAVTDTLRFARELHPGKRNGLDALCERYEIDNSKRTLHGALLDAELLAEVYLAMTRGQNALDMALPVSALLRPAALIGELRPLIVRLASEEEAAAHEAYLDEMEKALKGPSLWRQLAFQ